VTAIDNQLKWRRLTHDEDHENPEIPEISGSARPSLDSVLHAALRLGRQRFGVGLEPIAGAKISSVGL
jgi:hypothetical protein